MRGGWTAVHREKRSTTWMLWCYTKSACLNSAASATLIGMSTLGLSGSPQPTEGLWKGLFWPTIQNANDADLAATRGFWICFALAFVSVAIGSGGMTISIGISITTCLDLAIFMFYFLGAVGVRQASLVAALSMFAVYLLGTILYFWLSPVHFSFIRLVCLALLLTNLRAAFLIRKWRDDPLRQDDFAYGPTRSNETLRDKFVDQMPMRVWPRGQIVFYILAAVLIPIECAAVALIFVRHS
jgi:hypothetical protein